MGHDVYSFDPGFLLVPPYKSQYTVLEMFQRQFSRIANRLQPLRKTILEITNRRFLHQSKVFAPNLILVIKGEQIYPETIRRVRELKVPVINWSFDDPFSWSNEPLETISAYDHFIVVDQAYREHACAALPRARVSYLPQCCDPDVHKKIALTPSEQDAYRNDVCIVGSMYHHRAQMLEGIEDFDLGVWGEFWNRSSNKSLRRHYRGRSVFALEKTKVFNACKIVLNTHHPQAIRATNLRTFEVTGSGAFLLSDRREDLTRLYREGEEFVGFESNEDLRAKIAYYLAHPVERVRIAQQGQRRAYAEHTYELRLKQLLALI